MPALTPFGIFHTVIALLALACGFAALFRHREVAWGNTSGRGDVLLTAATAITGLFIFQHGGFGPPHALAILTLLMLAAGYAAERRAELSTRWRRVRAIAYSSTVFFHFIPALNETGTRLPTAAPLFSSPEDPMLKAAVGAVFAVFLVLLALQLRWIGRDAQRGPNARFHQGRVASAP